MQVLEVTPYGLAEVSGVSAVVLGLARDLVGRGHRVTIAAPGLAPRDLPPGVAVQSFEYEGPFRNAFISLRVARFLWRQRKDWEILHAHQGHPMTLIATMVFRTLGRPVVTTFHLLPPEPRGFRKIVQRFTFRQTAKLSTERVYVSSHTKRELRGDGRVIRNGIDVARVRSLLGDRDTMRRELALGGHVVAFSGRMASVKGYPDLLRAIRKVRDAGCDVRILATGRVPVGEREALETLIRDGGLGSAVLDLGDREDHIRFLPAADLFALPSYREGLPISLLEAMTAGLPVVATNVGGIPEVIEDGSEGFLVPVGDVDALAERILRLCEDPELRMAMGRRAFQKALAFESRGTADAYLSVFSECAGGGRR